MNRTSDTCETSSLLTCVEGIQVREMKIEKIFNENTNLQIQGHQTPHRTSTKKHLDIS